MGLMYLILLCLAILIMYAAAEAFYDVACMKGHEDRKYFWWSFLLPAIGYLLVIALPNVKKDQPSQWSETAAASEADHGAESAVNAGAAEAIAVCRKPDADEGQIVCPNCGQKQKEDRAVCWKCGVRFIK